jgi:hypothetical protein
VHLLPGFKKRSEFLSDLHTGAAARIATGMGWPISNRKHSEPPNFHSVSRDSDASISSKIALTTFSISRRRGGDYALQSVQRALI